MNKNIPSNLYKYGSFTKPDYLKQVLLDNNIYCSNPLDFNDPFDCRPRVDVGKTTEELRKTREVIEGILEKRTSLDRDSRCTKALGIIKKIQKHNDFTGIYNSLLSNAGVYCMSAKKDNLLMWAHYSDGHKGFCLKFTTEPEDSFFSNAEQVVYKTEYPVVKMYIGNKRDWGNESILTKSTDWEYEEEWRCISKYKGLLEFPADTLVGLIFGCKIEEKDKKQIIEWNAIRHHSLKMYQASIHKREYKLEIHEL